MKTDELKDFTIKVLRKHTVWTEEKISIERTSIEEAMKSVKEILESDETPEFGSYLGISTRTRTLDKSMTLMSVDENNGDCTIEARHKDKVFYSNGASPEPQHIVLKEELKEWYED